MKRPGLRSLADSIVSGGSNRIIGADLDPTRITPYRQRLLDFWSSNVWNFLTGTDEDGTQIVWTKDERDEDHPVKPFPRDKTYLQYLTYEFLDNKDIKGVLVNKTRQMYATTLAMLCILWLLLFRDARRVLVSRRTEEDAQELLRDKLRFPYSRLPLWVRKWRHIPRKPMGMAMCKETDSYALAVAENVAESEARGGTASVVMIDEAARTFYYGSIVRAIVPMATRYWAITTPPEEMILGAIEFQGHMEDIRSAPGRISDELIPGLTRTYDGVSKVLIDLEYTADEEKRDPAWEARERAQTDEAGWRREYKLDWSAPGSRPFYPEFVARKDKFIHKATQLLRHVPVLRGWDFGYHNPACIWAQRAPKTARFWVLRELYVKDMDVWNFRDLVRYLSGDLTFDELISMQRIKAIGWLNQCETLGYPPHPWFASDTWYQDYAGHEATKVSGTVEGESKERTDAEVLQSGGVNIIPHFTTHKASETIIRGLMLDRMDGWPGLLIDPACPIMLRGLDGGIQYPGITRGNPNPSEPLKDGYYDHLHDCLRYIVVNAVSVGEAEDATNAEWNTGQSQGPDHQGGKDAADDVFRLPSGLDTYWD